ncbi:MAG: leucine-rich repeat protein [Firmicutes bacterium]|nr:leucine-rich repeat protein [Bacillota bacterium]
MNYKKETMKRVLCFALTFVMALATIGFMPNVTEASTNVTAVQVAVGTHHTLVRLSNGEVWAWGSNERGQLGVNNNFAAVNNVPVQVPLAGIASYVAAGYLSSYAVIGGQLFAWGDNTHGQLGLAPANTPGNRRHTPAVVSGLPTVNEVAAGESHVLVRSGNEIWGFGGNHFGQTATNNTTNTVLPPTRTVGNPAANARLISAGANHSLAISHDNRLWSAGSNSSFQSARPTSSTGVLQYLNWSISPLIDPMVEASVNRASGGSNFTLTLINGNIYAYGTDNTNGRVGRTASSTVSNADRRANGGYPLNNHVASNNRDIYYISAGHNHSLAVNTSGDVFAWGSNSHGQLGNGTTASTGTGNNFNMVLTQGINTAISRVAAGGTHSVAIGQNGSVWAWGGNASGQLGDGTTTSRSTPVQVFRSDGTWVVSANHHFSFDAATGTIHAYTGPMNNLIIPSQINGVNVTRIANSAFEHLGLTGSLTMPNTLTNIGQRAFWGNNLTNIIVPSSVTSIGAYAFANNPNLVTAQFQHTDTTLLRTQGLGGILSNSDIFANTNANLRLYRLAGINPSFVVPPYFNRHWNVGAPGTGTNQGNFTFSLSGNAYTITGFVGNVPSGGNIMFPSTGPSGAPVRTIAGTVFQGITGAARSSITSITFQSPSSVTTIAANAFFGLPNLRSATIPASVQTIGATAFANCISLSEVHFEHVNGFDLRLNQIFASQSIFAGIPADTLRLTRPAGSDANSYVPFISPAGVTRNWFVGDGNAAWWNITPATGTGPVTITGFTGPNNLNSITIPSAIGERTVTGIAANVLTSANSPNLQEVVIPATVQTIANNAISGPNLVRVRLLHPDASTIQTIPANAFGHPDNRHANFRILFPAQSTGFTEPTWRGFPSQSDLLGAWEYTEWTGQGLIITGFTGTAATVQIPASIDGRPVRYIGPNIITNNAYLRELVIPASIVFISDNAINNAPNLEVVYLRHTNANVFTYFPETAFTGVHENFRLYFPIDSQGFTTPQWNGMRAFPQRWTYTISGGQVTITGFRGTEANVVIPSSIQGFPVRIIASETFRNNQTITSITIPASVTTIQPNAVFNCMNLSTVKLEHTNAAYLTSFAANAFTGISANFRIMFPYGATGFTTPVWQGYFAEPMTGETVLQYGYFEYTIRRVTLPGTGNVSSDEVVITRYMGSDTTVAIPSAINGIPVGGLGDAVFFHNTTVTLVTLPVSVRTIGSNTFAGATSLTSIDIPASVASIGNTAFMGASALATAFFNHSNGENVTFGDNTFTNTAPGFRIYFHANAAGFSTPTWRGFPAVPYGQALPPGTGDDNQGGNQPPVTQPRSFPVRTTDTFPGVTGQPILFRDGVGYVSLRAFAILIESDPSTEIMFNAPITGWATVLGRHTNGSEIALAVTSNDPRVAVTINGVQHSEIDLATWAGPLTGRARGQLRTINEGGNIFLPFRAVSNIFGYDVQMLDSNTVQFTALPAE